MSTAQEDKDAFLVQKAAAEQAVSDYTTAQADAEKAVQVAFDQQKEEEARVSIEAVATETVAVAEQNTTVEAQTSSQSNSSNQESNTTAPVTQPTVNEVASTPTPAPVKTPAPAPHRQGTAKSPCPPPTLWGQGWSGSFR